jgi:protein-S-isoprenylcysteine O-methyltransferase Ste14
MSPDSASARSDWPRAPVKRESGDCGYPARMGTTMPEPEPAAGSDRNKPYPPSRTTLSVLAGLLIFLVIVPFGFLLLLSTILAYTLHPDSVRWVLCLLLVAAGLTLDGAALWTFMRIGRGSQMPFTPTIQLVTTGPYSVIRNPILVAVSMYYLGVAALPFGWGAGFAVCLVSMLGGGLYYRQFEEPQLEARFGDTYRAYRARIPFVLPGPSRKPSQP